MIEQLHPLGTPGRRFVCFLKIYLFERDTDRQCDRLWGRGRGRERGREENSTPEAGLDLTTL